MNKFTKKFLLGLVLFIVFMVGLYGFLQNKKEIVRVKEIELSNVKDFHLASRTLMAFNGDYLYYFGKDGRVLDRIGINSKNFKIFFSGDYAFVLDLESGKINQYDDRGFLIDSFVSPVEVFNIEVQNKNIIIHVKEKDNETLYLRDYERELKKIYQTPNYILSFDVKNRENFAVAEIFADSTGHKSIVKLLRSGKKIEKTLMNEVVFALKNLGKYMVFVTDKALYKFDDEDFSEVKIPNVGGVLIDENKIYLLHSGILSTYSMGLKETDKLVVAANADRIEKISGAIYVIGGQDIGGELGSRREYYTRFPGEVDKVEINGLSLATLRNERLTLYKVIKTRSNPSKGAIKDIDDAGGKKD